MAMTIAAIVIGALSLMVSVVAVSYARRSANSSRRSATAAETSAQNSGRSAEAAERSAAAAETQVALAKEGITQEASELSASLFGQAALVTASLSNLGGIQVSLHNGGTKSIRELNLERISAEDAPERHWLVNPNVMPTPATSWLSVEPGATVEVPIVFASDTGDWVRSAGTAYTVVFSWLDHSGQRWRRTDSADPERI